MSAAIRLRARTYPARSNWRVACGRAAALLALDMVLMCGPARGEEGDRRPLVAQLTVTVSFLRPPPMSAGDVEALQQEVRRIWSAYGVEVIWIAHAATAVTASAPRALVAGQERLEVLILRSNPLDDAGTRGFHLASLSRRAPHAPPGGPDVLIVTTVERAHRLVRTALTGRKLGFGQNVETRLTARVLGRAIAHEIGHFLLGPQHADSGLMRATFGGDDALFDGGPRFGLAAKEVARLAAVVADQASGRLARRATVR